MVQGIGIISAMVLYKRNPKTKTKLEQLILKQKQHPSKQATVHSFPLKSIFSILALVLFLAFLQHFKNQFRIQTQKFRVQKQQKMMNAGNLMTITPIRQRTPFEQFEEQSQNYKFEDKNAKRQQSSEQQLKKIQEDTALIIKTVNVMHLIGVLVILALLGSAEIKLIKARKDKKEIVIKIYYIFGLKEQLMLPVGQKYRLQVYQSGQARFTFDDYHYEVRLINPDWQQENCEPHKILCHKSSRFQARKAVILLSSVLGLEIDQTIHKFGVHHEKMKKSNMKKTKKQTQDKTQ